MRELFKGKVDGEQREHNQSQQTTQNGRTALCCKPTNTITIFCLNTKFLGNRHLHKIVFKV